MNNNLVIKDTLEVLSPQSCQSQKKNERQSLLNIKKIPKQNNIQKEEERKQQMEKINERVKVRSNSLVDKFVIKLKKNKVAAVQNKESIQQQQQQQQPQQQQQTKIKIQKFQFIQYDKLLLKQIKNKQQQEQEQEQGDQKAILRRSVTSEFKEEVEEIEEQQNVEPPKKLSIIINLFTKKKKKDSRDYWKRAKVVVIIMKLWIALKNNLLTAKQQDQLKFEQLMYLRYSILPLQPNDQIKFFWNCSMIIMLILTVLITPVRVCFIDDVDSDDWYNFDMFFTVYFALDIVMNFISAYYDEANKLVYSYKQIALNYMKGWFLIDIISIFPFEILGSGNTQVNKLVRLMRLPRLYKLQKMIKLQNASNFFNDLNEIVQISQGVRNLLGSFLFIVVMTHLVACLWYLLARLNDFDEETWVARFDIQSKPYFTRYIAAYYWGFQTVTTVGYGDIASITVAEQILAVIWMIIGVGFYSVQIGSLGQLIKEMDYQQTQLDETLGQFNEITQNCEIPFQIQQKINYYFESNFKENKFWGQNIYQLQDELMIQNYEELNLFTDRQIIETVDVFKIDLRFTAQILPTMQIAKMFKDDAIYRQNDPPDEIYFILKGEVQYMNSQGHELVQIKKGSMFGEIEVYEQTNRQYFAVAKKDLTLLVCKSYVFLDIISKFEELSEYINEIIEGRKLEIIKENKKFEAEQDITMVGSLLSTKKGTQNNKLAQLVNMCMKFGNKTSFIEQKQRIEKFSDLYSENQRQLILSGDQEDVLKTSTVHFSLFLENLYLQNIKNVQELKNNKLKWQISLNSNQNSLQKQMTNNRLDQVFPFPQQLNKQMQSLENDNDNNITSERGAYSEQNLIKDQQQSNNNNNNYNRQITSDQNLNNNNNQSPYTLSHIPEIEKDDDNMKQVTEVQKVEEEEEENLELKLKRQNLEEERKERKINMRYSKVEKMKKNIIQILSSIQELNKLKSECMKDKLKIQRYCDKQKQKQQQ